MYHEFHIEGVYALYEILRTLRISHRVAPCNIGGAVLWQPGDRKRNQSIQATYNMEAGLCIIQAMHRMEAGLCIIQSTHLIGECLCAIQTTRQTQGAHLLAGIQWNRCWAAYC